MTEPLPIDCIGRILQFTGPHTAARAARVNTSWEFAAGADWLWHGFAIEKWSFAADRGDEESWRDYFVRKVRQQVKWRRGAPRDFRMLPMRGHENYVECISKFDKLVASGSADGTARVWRFEGSSFEEVGVFASSGVVSHVHLTNEFAFVAGDTLRVYSLESKLQVGEVAIRAAAMAVDDENDIVVIGGHDGAVLVFNTRLQGQGEFRDICNGPIKFLQIAWDKRQQVVCGTEDVVKILDVRRASISPVLYSYNAPAGSAITSLSWCPAANCCVIGERAAITLLDTRTGATLHTRPCSSVTCVAIHETCVAYGCSDGRVYCNSALRNEDFAGKWKELKQHGGGPGGSRAVNSISVDEFRVVSVGCDNAAYVSGAQDGVFTFALLGGSLVQRAENPSHPSRPGMSGVLIDDSQIIASVNSLMRAYRFDVK